MEYLLIIFGIAFLCWAYFKTTPYRNSKHWHETVGVILTFEESTYTRPEVYVNIEYVHPEVTYEYIANKKKYKNSKVSFEKENIMKHTSNKNNNNPWENWSVNRKIPVYFNPENNSESVAIRNLLPKRKSHYHSLYISGLLCIIAGITLLGIKA